MAEMTDEEKAAAKAEKERAAEEKKAAAAAERESNKGAAKDESDDEKFQREWVAGQRRAYPEIYRDADKRMANPGRAATLGERLGAEPGHDPSLFEQYEKDAKDGAASAGSDNYPPHETTPPQTGLGTVANT